MESTNQRTAMSIFVYSVYGAIVRLPVIVQSEERELLGRRFLKEKLTQLFSQKLWVISEHCRYLNLPYMPHWRLHFVFQARWLAARRCRRWRAASAWCPSTAAARRGCTSARTPSPVPISGLRPPSSPTLESAQVSDWHAHAESCDPELNRRSHEKLHRWDWRPQGGATRGGLSFVSHWSSCQTSNTALTVCQANGLSVCVYRCVGLKAPVLTKHTHRAGSWDWQLSGCVWAWW